MFRDDLFNGAHILVTGGGTGLGRMMAERLLALGASVEIWGRRGPVLEQTVAEMNAAHPGRAFWRSVDIKDPAAIDDAVEAMWSAGRPATHLINNAAGNFVSRTEDLPCAPFMPLLTLSFTERSRPRRRLAGAGSRRRPAARWSPSSSPGCAPAHPLSYHPPCRRPVSTQ